MFRVKLGAAAVAIGLTCAAPAWADLIQFNPTGAGAGAGDQVINQMQLMAGNTIAEGISLASSPAIGTTFNVLFQANLQTAGTFSEALLPVDTVFSSSGKYFTFTANFTEVVTAVTPTAGGGVALTFGLAPGVNQFSLYADTASGGNNITGNGFTSGSLILQGSIIPSYTTPTGNGTFSSTFTFNCITAAPYAGGPPSPTNCAENIDQFNPSSVLPGAYTAGINTVQGNGNSQVPVDITLADPNYFPNLIAGSAAVFALASPSEFLPYDTVDPSQQFFTGAGGIGTVGPVNGLTGPNTMFESDTTAKFNVIPSPVPEPATLSLLGIGLAVSGLRKRAKKNQK